MNKVIIGNGMVVISECELQELVSYKEDYDKLLEENRIIKEGNEALSEEIQETKNAYYQLHQSAIKEVTKLREKRDKLSQEIVDIYKEHEIEISDILKESLSVINKNEILKEENTLLENRINTFLKEKQSEIIDVIEAAAKTVNSLNEKNALLESKLNDAKYNLSAVLDENESLVKENESLKFAVDLLKS